MSTAGILSPLALCIVIVSACVREPGTPLPTDERNEPPPDDTAPPPPPPPPPPSVFDTSRLHEISIVVEARHLQRLADQTDQRVPCTFTFDGTTLAEVGIRRKGSVGSSAALDEKPGFSVKLDEFRKGQDLDGLDKLLLNNAAQDLSFLNEHLGYELYRRAGVPAPRTSHAVVRLNGEVFGLYVVKEAIDRDFLRRHFNGQDDGNLYEGCCADDFAYMPELPELKHEAEEGRTRADLLEFARFLDEDPDASFAAQLALRLDLDRFLASWAVDALAGHWDGFTYNNNNYYIYHNPEDGRFVFLPHGMDQLFQEACFDPFELPSARLARRIGRIPELAARLRQELVRIAGEPTDPEALSAYVEAARSAVHAGAVEDAAFQEDLAFFDEHLEPTLAMLTWRRQLLSGLNDAVCGDGRQHGLELCGCDDGNTLAGDGCNARCAAEYCGDGIVQGSEVCDAPGCNVTCTGPAVCGDTVLDFGEDCDDGNTEPFDGCDACRFGCFGDSREGRRYAFCLPTMPADAARLACLGLGGELVVPADEAENSWLSSRADAAGVSDFWVGITDATQEGSWRTFAGAPVSYLQWDLRSPNGALGQNCAVSESWRDGDWNDKACDEEYAFICHLP